MPSPGATTLDRLELRIERLRVTFRFTYAFHAREVRFEIDRGSGFERLFPETFSFHAGSHDPAELFLQLQDLEGRPALISPAARARDTQLLTVRLVRNLPTYLEALLLRLEADAHATNLLQHVWQDMALIAQIAIRFSADSETEQRPGLRTAVMHLRKLLYHCMLRLLERRVEPAYLAGYVHGREDPVDPADDLSEAGFFATLEGTDQAAVNRCLVRLAERFFYRWLEDVCLDEDNEVFDSDDSPFESREVEVHTAIRAFGSSRVERGRDLVQFLRRSHNRDCLRVLDKLQAWFLRRYDVHHAAVMIRHANNMTHGRDDANRVLSRHHRSTYLIILAVLVAPFLGAAFAYRAAPLLFDLLCSAELLLATFGVLWFLLYSFLVRRELAFFHASVPRILAGIIVGYLPIFFIDEIWSLANRSFFTLIAISIAVGLVTLLYLYVEVQGRLGDTPDAFERATSIFLLGVVQAAGVGLLFTGMIGPFMAMRNWVGEEHVGGIEALRHQLPPFAGQLPQVIGVEPLYAFPAAVFVMTFMSFFIGIFLQLMWEDLPITEPL